MSMMPTDRLPEGDEKRAAVRSMFDSIAPRYDVVNRILTFRLDVRWRRITQDAMGLAPGSLVLDLAAGTGDFAVDLAKRGHHPVGIDLSYGMLAAARTDAPLVQGDLLQLPVADGAADGAVCGFALRNLVDLEPFFSELARVTRPGGRIALLDVSQPANPVIRWGHGFYFNTVVPRIGGLLSDRTAYGYLPRSVSYLPPAEVMVAALAGAGFDDVEHRSLSGGITQLMLATRTSH
jgi:demethylmenaquinone methyltransferase/2-methoxy-6-polyprenyl-1,4-benzoquinol methylase